MIHTSKSSFCLVYQELKWCFEFLSQLDILCTSAVKRYYAKNNNLPFSRVPELLEAKNVPPSSSDLILVIFLL